MDSTNYTRYWMWGGRWLSRITFMRYAPNQKIEDLYNLKQHLCEPVYSVKPCYWQDLLICKNTSCNVSSEWRRILNANSSFFICIIPFNYPFILQTLFTKKHVINTCFCTTRVVNTTDGGLIWCQISLPRMFKLASLLLMVGSNCRFFFWFVLLTLLDQIYIYNSYTNKY